MVRKQVPGVEVFGGVDLNLTVGGMNPSAVEHMTQVSGGYGRLVWMSTFDAENQVRYSKENRPFVSVSRNGALLPATKDVIGVIAKHGLVLATGHVSADEGLLLLREGRQQGVQHMVVTHAMNTPVLMTVAQMQEAAKLGALIEFVGGSPAGAGGRRADRQFRGRHPQGGSRGLHPRERSRPEEQSAPRRRLRGVHRRAEGERVQRPGARSDGEAESRHAVGTALKF